MSQEDQCCSVTVSTQNERREVLVSSHEEADYRLLVSIFQNQR